MVSRQREGQGSVPRCSTAMKLLLVAAKSFSEKRAFFEPCGINVRP